VDNPEAYLGRLKPIFIFKGLTDDQILAFAKELVVERHGPDETVFSEGDEGQAFYIINRGTVRVTRSMGRRGPKHVATLVPGDFFGERSLLYGRRRSATIETGSTGEVELLRLSKEDFERLLRTYPQIKPNLALSTESLELYRANPFSWLGPNEVVYLIARKHKMLLYQSLALPALAALVVALAAIWLAVASNNLLIAWLGVALEAPIAGWLLWNWIDWGNDFYIVTNQRLIYLEKIIGIYDSRQETPLSSIMSVNVQTDDSFQRALHMGDVIVRTFSGPITLKSVNNPTVLAAAIEQHWLRTRTRERESQLEQMRSALKNRLEHGPEGARLPGKPAAKPSKPPPTPPIWEQLAGFFSFRVRFEEGNSVIYRKHWFMLFQGLWKPGLGMLIVMLLVVAELIWQPAGIPLTAVLLIAVVALIPLAGWWLYEFIDWRNDIYMVTEDQIFDVTKKPLGAETKKSAPLGNVLSLKYERPGLIGVMLNYGTVVAQVAGTEFRFEGVFDPVGVQNDVYRRIEMQNNKKAAAEAARKRDEMADWLTVYHGLQDELDKQQGGPPPSPAPKRP
jgi:CRP-like cAMP-binding protein